MRSLLLLAVLFLNSFAGAEFKVPALTGPVVDTGHLISVKGEERLNTLIRKIHDTGKAQITVLTVPSLEGEAIEQASIKVTDKWQLGGKKNDNGVLIMLAQKEHKVRIEVGQGLEGDIPDVWAKRIVSDVMVPYFKKGDFDNGFYAGVLSIAQRAGAKLDEAAQYQPSHESRGHGTARLILIIFFLAIYLIIMISSRGRYFGGGGYYGGGGGWGGGFGGGSSSGGWSGGGGGFSGGGASGDW